MADRNLFSSLKRLFSSDVIIRNVGGTELKVMDVDRIQQSGVLQNNSLIDRFNRLYTTSNSYAYNYNIIQNFQALKFQLYTDYEGMDTDAIISSALDVLRIAEQRRRGKSAASDPGGGLNHDHHHPARHCRRQTRGRARSKQQAQRCQ